MLVGCVGGGSNFLGLIHEFLDDKEIEKVGVEASETAALSNGTPGIMQGMKTYMLQNADGSKSLGGASLGAGIQYFSVGPQHSFLKDQGAVKYTSATDEEALNAYKLVSKLENISPSLEPSHAFATAISLAPKLSKDTILCIDSCGHSLKDSDIIKEKLGFYTE